MRATVARELDSDQRSSQPTEVGARLSSARNLAIVACFLAVYATFIPRILGDLSPLTGDEPFYVMTALSLARDGDLDESNNYARRDYDSFYPPNPLPTGWRGWPAFPRDLPPHPAQTSRPGLYSKHGLGVALLILIPYVVGERVAVLLLLNLVAALVALNIALLARRYTAGWVWPTAIAAVLALSNPLMSYAYLIFPEVFAALAIVYAYRRALAADNSTAQWLLVGLALGLLPWLHARFIPAVAGLLVVIAWRTRAAGAARRLPVPLPSLAPLLGSGVALVGYYLYVYGRPFPSAADHAGFNDPLATVNAFFGLLLDEQWGLLIYAPVYLLVLLTAATFWRHARVDALALLIVVAPYLLLVAWYRVWWGEWGPPARYLAPIAPLAAAPLACWVARARPFLAVPAIVLAALPGFAVMGGFLAAPQLMYNHPDGHSALFKAWAAQLDGRTWPKVIPSFQFYSPSSGWRRFAWSLLLAAVVLLPWLAPDAKAADEDAG